jgi:DNA-3-methyladenine glycosylase I
MAKKRTMCRCPWVDLAKPDYVAYHDKEWGVPVYDDRVIFEFLTLEAAQAGLSWYTVLRKRENYRVAFSDFDPEKVARYNERKILKLIADPGIIRNRAKIRAAVHKPIANTIRGPQDYVATSRESDAMSKDLKARGFKFVGSTICYAHMQATGMVNDHLITCFRRQEILKGYRR